MTSHAIVSFGIVAIHISLFGISRVFVSRIEGGSTSSFFHKCSCSKKGVHGNRKDAFRENSCMFYFFIFCAKE